MIIELQAVGLKVEGQMGIDVFYRRHLVGRFAADLFVEDRIIVELKSVRRIAKAHEVQLVHYLTATSINVGLLINFGEMRVEVKRKWRTFSKHPIL